jgi:hypothetical protein
MGAFCSTRPARDGPGAAGGRSVVVTRLEEVDHVGRHPIYQPVLLGQPARPDAALHVAEGLGLADATERIAQHGLDQIERPQGHLAVGTRPVPQVLAKLGLKDREVLRLSLTRHPAASPLVVEPEIPPQLLDRLRLPLAAP